MESRRGFRVLRQKFVDEVSPRSGRHEVKLVQNARRSGEGWPAASPLAVRKGWAFPSCENTNQPHPLRLEGVAFQAEAMRNNHGFGAERRSLSAQRSGRAA